MKVFGYQKDKKNLVEEDLMELREVSFLSNIEELEKLITFLQEIKTQHSKLANKFINETDLCHSHFRDWDTSWETGSVDVIIVTVNGILPS